MKFFLKARHYYLREGGGIRRYVQSRFLWRDKLVRTNDFFSDQEITEKAQKANDEFMKIIQDDEVMFSFWQSTNEKIKAALLFSYWSRKFFIKNKVCNVEISYEWPVDKIHQKHIGAKSFRSILKTFNFKKIVNEIIVRHGTHIKNLRYKRIHLVVDSINGKQVCGAHVDTRYPSFLSKNAFYHLIFDDILS